MDKTAMKKRLAGNAIWMYLALYFALSLLVLDKFPFMHSDESWLSGLTRAMTVRGLDTTEPFFDLVPRYPHAIKTLFHLMQMPLIEVFGYNLFAVRLLSLIFGTAALYMAYRIALLLCGSPMKSLILTAILSLDVQFLYASHFARQDIIVAFGMLAVIYYIMRHAEAWNWKRDVIAGVMTGLCVGLHPNSLLVALCAGILYLYFIALKQMKLRNLLLLVGVVTGCTAVFVGISLSFDSQFFPHYMQLGDALGVGMSFGDKLSAFPLYYIKLFLQISGTYYTPPIQPQLIVFAIVVLGAAVYAFKDHGVLRLLLPLIAVNVGIIVIGRYSQPGVIFIFPLGYLLVFALADKLLKRWAWLPAALLGAAVIAVSAWSAVPWLNHDYDDYLCDIRASVPSSAKVLANLNAEYAFDEGQLLDYRNLEYLAQSGLTFEEYVSSRGIEYILYPEEMDYIYQHRPVWNIVYGNLYPYYDDMQRFPRGTLHTGSLVFVALRDAHRGSYGRQGLDGAGIPRGRRRRMIPFNRPYYDERDAQAVHDALLGGADFRPQAAALLESRFPGRRAFLTTSGSAAFELLFAGLGFKPDSEVIMPSFTFPSCASAALRAGLRPVFADIDEATLTLDLDEIERKTTARTRCVAVTHYGGSSPDMSELIRRSASSFIIEDAALSIGAYHRGRPLGGIADAGILSFHETKNVSAGEGGALLIDSKHAALLGRLQTIYDNGTDKAAFLRGEVSGYTWQMPGLNVAMPNLSAALLCAQLEKEEEITRLHRRVCECYREAFSGSAPQCGFTLPHIPPENTDNGHVFWLLFEDHAARERVRAHLAKKGISAYFHYMPLHASAMGATLEYRPGGLPVTQRVSECLLRLPVWAGLTQAQCAEVAAAVREAL